MEDNFGYIQVNSTELLPQQKLSLTYASATNYESTTTGKCIGADWFAKCKMTKIGQEKPLFKCEVFCNRDYHCTQWACDATVTFTVLTKLNPKLVSVDSHVNFRFDRNIVVLEIGIEEPKDVETAKDFDQYTVGIVVHSFQGQKSISAIHHQYDLQSPNIDHDKVLVFKDKKFYVQSVALSMWSKYFDNMFKNPNFEESKKKEIEIKNVDADQFNELLLVIYPTQKPVEGRSVEFLLKLADMYDMPLVIEKCSDYLLKIPTDQDLRMLSFLKRLQLIVNYKLIDAQEAFVKYVSKGETMFEGIQSQIFEDPEEYREFSEPQRLFLLDLLMAEQAHARDVQNKIERERQFEYAREVEANRDPRDYY